MIDRKQINAKRFFGLDFLRVLAVSMILFSHSSWIYISNGLLGKLQDMSGFLGIELFIVLSGFLIGGIMYRQFLESAYTLKDGCLFLYRRLMRLLPSYYLVIIINAIVFSAFGFSIKGIWKYFLLIQNFASPVSAFFPESWSLPVKELGYIFAILLLLIISNVFIKASKKLVFLGVIIGLMLVVLFLKVNYTLHSTNLDLKLWSFQVRSVVIYRVDSVLIAVLLGYFYQNYKEKILSRKILFMILGGLLLISLAASIVFLRLSLSNAPWFWNIVCLPLVSLAICLFIPFLLSIEPPTKRIESTIRFICKISYSIYLLHYSFILFLLKNFVDTTHYNIWQLNTFTLCYLLITIGLSYILYNYFERPINEYRTKNIKLNDKQ